MTREVGRTVTNWFLPATVFATFWLILIGIYTAAVGAGLACDARWPLCDGAVFGLFPANWPSFVEWFHRLVAMLTGLMILGSWWVVWRGRVPHRAKVAMSLAVVLLPIQVWLGAETVFQYEIAILTAHFLTALLIFGALIAGLWWTRGQTLTPKLHRRILGAISLSLLPFVALTPQFLVVHSGRVQVLYYGIGLAIFAGFLVIGLHAFSRRPRDRWLRGGLAFAGVGLMAVQLLAGRLVRSPLVHAVDWTATGLLVGVLGLLLWGPARIQLPPPRPVTQWASNKVR